MHIKNNKGNKIENKSGIYLIFVFLLAGQLVKQTETVLERVTVYI